VRDENTTKQKTKSKPSPLEINITVVKREDVAINTLYLVETRRKKKLHGGHRCYNTWVNGRKLTRSRVTKQHGIMGMSEIKQAKRYGGAKTMIHGGGGLVKTEIKLIDSVKSK